MDELLSMMRNKLLQQCETTGLSVRPVPLSYKYNCNALILNWSEQMRKGEGGIGLQNIRIIFFTNFKNSRFQKK